jgi:hypothetical protein
MSVVYRWVDWGRVAMYYLLWFTGEEYRDKDLKVTIGDKARNSDIHILYPEPVTVIF